MFEDKSTCEKEDLRTINFNQIFHLINKINKKYEKLQRKIIQDENLTSAQYSILQQLWESDARPFKDLASACCCSQSTITGIIDTMEKNKLVYRKANPNDRRSILVVLTDKGKKIENMTPPIEPILKSCCGDLKVDEINQLITLLKKLSSSFDPDEVEEC
ncbi:MAG: MarR family winged helix-turn-helix transcriptional regulator [Promethearchaeota archaeon]